MGWRRHETHIREMKERDGSLVVVVIGRIIIQKRGLKQYVVFSDPVA